MKKICSLILCFIFIFSITPSIPAAAEEKTENRVIRVGSPENIYDSVNEQGERSGYGYEYLQKIANYTGWKFEYVACTWDDCFEKLENGEIDILEAISYTDERARIMDFSDKPITEEKYYIFAKVGETDIAVSDLTTFEGRDIGVLKEHLPEEVLNEWEEKNNIHMQHVNITTKEQTVERFKKQEIECFVSVEGEFWGEYGMAPVVSIGSSPIYFAVNKDKPEIKRELDDAMFRISEEYPFFAEDLYKQYFTEVSIPILTREEKDWILQHGKIRMGYLKNDGAVSTYDSDTGEVKGLIKDYVRLAKECLYDQKLDFELIGYDTRYDVLEGLYNGDVDMVFYVAQNPASAEEWEYDLSETAWSINMEVITTKELFDEGEEYTVAITGGITALKSYIARNYPKWKLVEYDSQDEVVAAVKNGEADCFVIDVNKGDKYTQNRQFNAFALSKPNKASFAVACGNINLLSILNKTLKTISTAKLTGLLNMHANNMKKFTILDYIKTNWWQIGAVIAVIFLIILFIILVAFKKTRKAMVEAENANFAKSSFLSNMSHDIRTPINGIIGMLSIIKKNNDNPEKVQECLGKIEMSSNLLLSLVNDVLDMSKLDSNAIILTNETVNLDDLCEEVTAAVSFQAEEAGIQVSGEHDDYTDIVVKTSPLHFKKILLNLFTNAIKYNKPHGSIHTSMRTIERTKDSIVCEFKIADTGIGMSEEYIKKGLFKPFSQAEDSARSKYNGSGLGMSIVKKLVEMMNGTIAVESKEGEGSCFTVVLPFEIDHSYTAKDKEREDGEDIDISGMNILLVEDNELNMEIAHMILEDEGARVSMAFNGAEALHKFEEAEPGVYDAILMDVMMPEMDGLTATKKIRELKRADAKTIPILAMTANAFAEDEKKCLEAGMNAHIAKPLDVKKIKKALNKFVVRNTTK